MKRLPPLVANKRISGNLVKLLKRMGPSRAAPNSVDKSSAALNSAGKNSAGKNSAGKNSAGKNSVGKNSADPNATAKNDAAKTVLKNPCYQTKTTTARQQLGTITALLTYDIAWLLAF